MNDYLRPMGTTHWKNPTNQVLRVRIWDTISRKRVVEVFQPGETRALPAYLDRAIQKVRNGKIVGGLAPQLQRVGAPVRPIEPAIDSEAAARKASLSAVQTAQALKDAANAQLAEAARLVAATATDPARPADADKASGQHANQQGQQQRRDGK